MPSPADVGWFEKMMDKGDNKYTISLHLNIKNNPSFFPPRLSLRQKSYLELNLDACSLLCSLFPLLNGLAFMFPPLSPQRFLPTGAFYSICLGNLKQCFVFPRDLYWPQSQQWHVVGGEASTQSAADERFREWAPAGWWGGAACKKQATKNHKNTQNTGKNPKKDRKKNVKNILKKRTYKRRLLLIVKNRWTMGLAGSMVSADCIQGCGLYPGLMTVSRCSNSIEMKWPDTASV